MASFEPLAYSKPPSLRERWRSFLSWLNRCWTNVKPGPEASKGLVLAVCATVIWAAVVGALNLNSGFGFVADLLFALLIAAIGIPLITLIAAILLRILSALPRLLAGFLIGAALFLSLLFFGPLSYVVALMILLTEGLLGAAVATLLFGKFSTLVQKPANDYHLHSPGHCRFQLIHVPVFP